MSCFHFILTVLGNYLWFRVIFFSNLRFLPFPRKVLHKEANIFFAALVYVENKINLPLSEFWTATDSYSYSGSSKNKSKVMTNNMILLFAIKLLAQLSIFKYIVMKIYHGVIQIPLNNVNDITLPSDELRVKFVWIKVFRSISSGCNLWSQKRIKRYYTWSKSKNLKFRISGNDVITK